MTLVRYAWRSLLVAAALLAPLGATIQHANAGQLAIDIPNCTPTATASGNLVTITCGGTTTTGAPSGCVATASTTSLTSSGGSVTLSASCGGGAPTQWTWTKNSVSFGANSSSQSDTLPANGASSPVSYTYAVTASNESGAAPSASVTVTVAAAGVTPPPPPPPTTGEISCSGYTKTIVLDIPWQNSTSSHSATTNNQGFGPNDAVVVRFTVPAGTAPTGAGMSGNIGMAEWGGGQFQRFAKLSRTPCDFAIGSWLSDTFTGISISFPIYVSTPAPAYAGATLQPGTTYYLNVRNKDQYGNTTCRSETGGSCDMFVDMFLPR